MDLDKMVEEANKRLKRFINKKTKELSQKTAEDFEKSRELLKHNSKK